MILPPSPTGEIWLIKIAVEALLLILLISRGMAKNYAGLAFYLAIAVSKSITILVCMQSPGGYYPAWTRLQWISLGGYAILTVQCLHLMARHFRRIGFFAAALFCVFGTVSLLLALTISGVGARWWSPEVHRLAGLTRYYGVVCLLVMGMARVFFWGFKGKVRMASNTTRVATGSMLILIASAIGHSVKPWWLSDAFVVGGPLAVFAWLCMRLRASGEDALIPPPASPEDIERWRRESEEKQRQLMERIRLRMKLG